MVQGVIEVLYLDEGEVVSAGADGFIRVRKISCILALFQSIIVLV